MRVDNLGTFIPHMTLWSNERWPDKVIDNSQTLIVAHTGHGKTLAEEKLMEEYHNSGYTVIVITEKPKAPFESAFAAFPATAKYHREYLKQQRMTPQGKKIKLYHPATMSPELRNNSAPIRFFTIPIKSITTQELTVLLEVDSRHDSVRILQNNISKLGTQESMLDLLWNADRSIKRQTQKLAAGIHMPKFDEDFLIPAPESGTAKNISDIKSSFEPFMTHYVLTSQESPLHLDWKSILQDQEHYHIFSRAFIPESDDRIVYFIVNWILNQISEHAKYMKNPVLIVIQEAKVFLPNNTTEVYIKKTADNMEKKLSTLRSNGFSSVADSQGYYDLAEGYRNSVNETMIGRLSPADLERYAKALRLPPRMRESISGLPKNEYYRKGHNERVVMLFPRHAHKEEMQDFFKIWRHWHQKDPEAYPMQDHKEILKIIQELKKNDLTRAKKRVEDIKKGIQQKARDKEAELAAQEKAKESKVTEKQALKGEKERIEDERRILIYQQSKMNPALEKAPSWKKLADEYHMSDKTIKKYAQEGKELMEKGRAKKEEVRAEEYIQQPPEEQDNFSDEWDPEEEFDNHRKGHHE